MSNTKNSEKNPNNGLDKLRSSPRDLGHRAADRLSQLAGSWAFIFGFIIFLCIWMSANIFAFSRHWDPYPFILLNLVLSCLAAIQAPIILMSQNRQLEKDRQKTNYDYLVNRKSERKIEEVQKQINKIDRKLTSLVQNQKK